ncbi:MAG TPA: FKBP-type peptidyl-prolyl cis-trans isomerase [Bacteroidia bacterium]|jgi:FKBP-type peptidyl-prolyl cis-trans isomerase FkpA|nr:FKBP-type peptidyl-prolyl cis-trans isomerase [Bacteroidia bacterium]
MKKLIPVILAALVLFSCKKKASPDQAAIDNQIITSYISSHNLQAKPTGTGLYYQIDVQGTGAQATSSSTVTVVYNGYLTDGTVFDHSNASGITCALSSVIQGWQQGIPLFKVGGRGKLLIPSALGYGTQGSGSIPPNAVLIFDISLTNVQ